MIILKATNEMLDVIMENLIATMKTPNSINKIQKKIIKILNVFRSKANWSFGKSAHIQNVNNFFLRLLNCNFILSCEWLS
jgi:hypothetical protein